MGLLGESRKGQVERVVTVESRDGKVL